MVRMNILLRDTYFPKDDLSLWTGVDRGAYILAKHGIEMEYAIGDFDSLEENEEFELVKQYAKTILRLNPIKDDSDSEYAFQYLLGQGYDDLQVYGALGGRIDHTYVNMKLAYRYPSVQLLDAHQRIQSYGKGEYTFPKGEYQYFSVFTEEESTITLEGMKYPLHKKTITYRDCYTLSNEIIDEVGKLIVHDGHVLVIQSDDKK